MNDMRHPLHDVLRHALRAHRAVGARARFSGDRQLAGHLAPEEHAADQRLRPPRGGIPCRPGVLGCDWRKGSGSRRMIEIGKRERFYRQECCGGVYSPRDRNRQRRAGTRADPARVQFHGPAR